MTQGYLTRFATDMQVGAKGAVLTGFAKTPRAEFGAVTWLRPDHKGLCVACGPVLWA